MESERVTERDADHHDITAPAHIQPSCCILQSRGKLVKTLANRDRIAKKKRRKKVDGVWKPREKKSRVQPSNNEDSDTAL